MLDYKEKICLVTGAGNKSGIGYGIALTIGRLGGTIIITGTTSRIFERRDELIEMGIDANAFVVDLCCRDAVDRMFSDIKEQLI